LCEYEDWPYIEREDYTLRLRVFDVRSWRKIFCHKRYEVRGDWRRHEEELHDRYFSPGIRVIY
jgi:hypothetical protein